MVPELVLVICTIIEIFVILWGLSQLQAFLREEMAILEESLDQKLAAAIQSTGLVSDGEPVNPVQAAIAGLIQNMATNQQNPKRIELKRDEKGLFEKQE
tara:strand:+ start:1129 stop:1425 length:297 start_codon:yes stop_codon:yes gene_type:complete